MLVYHNNRFNQNIKTPRVRQIAEDKLHSIKPCPLYRIIYYQQSMCETKRLKMEHKMLIIVNRFELLVLQRCDFSGEVVYTYSSANSTL